MTDETATTDLVDQTCSIVGIGNFNPRIFQPEWLRANGVIGQSEAEECIKNGLEVIHGQVTVLNLEQMRVEVTETRFMVQVNEAPLISGKDFFAKCLQLLSHTPISSIGINFTSIFTARNQLDWNALGDTLAPKAPWSKLLGEFDSKDRKGGLRHMIMERSMRGDGRPGSKQVHVTALDQPRFGTQVLVNDHYEFGEDSRADVAMDLLEDRWVVSEKEATDIVTSIRGLARAI